MYFTRAYFHFVETSVFTSELIVEVILQHIDVARDYRNFALAIRKAGLISLRPIVRNAAMLRFIKHTSQPVVQLPRDIPRTMSYSLLPNGKYHGEYELRTTHGALIARRTFVEGKITGCAEEFYERDLYRFEPGKLPTLIAKRPGEHGLPRHRAEYKNDKLHGPSVSYSFVNGNKIEQEDYVDGLRHGKHIEWSYNGALRLIIDYCMGERHGDEIHYHPTGECQYKASWINGKHHGRAETYDTTRRLTRLRTYNHGVLEGEAVDTNAAVRERFWYARGKLNGKYEKYWLPSGHKFYECWYRDDKQHGKENFFDTVGKMVKSARYYNGKLNGVERMWSGPRYRLVEEVHWRNGYRHGKQKMWNENGKLTSVELYVHGTKVNKTKKIE